MRRDFDARHVEVFLNTENVTVVGYRNVLVQVRTGHIGLEEVDGISAIVRTMRVGQTGRCAMLAVLEETAEIPSQEVRARQGAAIRTLLEDPRSYGAVVIAGSGARATMLRAITRLLGVGRPRQAVCSTTTQAARWLAEQQIAEASVLVGLADYTRTLARSPPPAAPPSAARGSRTA